MSPLPTESRIFADRYMRDLRRAEAKMSNLIAPGTSNWNDAMLAFFERVADEGSPLKRAKTVLKMTHFLNDSVVEGSHFLLDSGGGKRSAGLMFATMSAGENPFVGVDEEGVLVTKHMLVTRRNGSIRVLPDVCMAYISKHAVGRMHERGHNLSDSKASCIMACIGILGLLTRDSEKHIDSGLCMQYDDTLVVGSLKHAMKNIREGVDINGTLYDVRTALPVETVANREMLEQGVHATNAVAKWLDDRTISRKANVKTAETIPFMPRRDDYTLASATPDRRSNP